MQQENTPEHSPDERSDFLQKVDNLEVTIKDRCALALSYAEKKREGNPMSMLQFSAVMDDLFKSVLRCVLKTAGQGKAQALLVRVLEDLTLEQRQRYGISQKFVTMALSKKMLGQEGNEGDEESEQEAKGASQSVLARVNEMAQRIQDTMDEIDICLSSRKSGD